MRENSEIYDKRRIYSISRLTREIKEILEQGFENVWVEGEVSNFKSYPSGHLYFSLKDEGSVISCVLFKREALKLAFDVRDGISVLARGRISVYDKRGQYQLYVSQLEPKGKGALQAAFEELKEKLRKEGLFESARKRALPFLPRRIGVVTSSSGAAIEDILNVTVRRFANIEILIRPVKVQGSDAKDDIASAIGEFNEYNSLIKEGNEIGNVVDVLIVGRGGGSIEDLWAFNEEIVARAISASDIPVISAVGHEVDYTISDFAADFRAPTPSAAAELVMPRKDELEDIVLNSESRLTGAVKAVLEISERTVKGFSSRYVLKDPGNILVQKKQELDDLWEDLAAVIKKNIEKRSSDMAVLSGKLDVLSPLRVLERGYSITFKTGKPVTEISNISCGEQIKTKLARGSFDARVERVINE